MEQSLLERELEKANLPPNYNQYTSYSREQQFQADIVNKLAEESFDHLVDLKGLVVENYDRRRGGQYIPRVHISPEEVKKYVHSALYKKAVNRLTARIRNAALCHDSDFLDNITAVNNALNELKGLLSLRPYVFKKVYQDCFQDIEETAKPLLALVGLTEEMFLEEQGLPPCQVEWDSEYTKCVNHFEQLK